MEQNKVLLSVENLSVHYGQIRAVKKIDLTVHRGEMVALIGSNGAGKSTLINAVIGLQKVAGGRIVLDGRDITRLSPEKIIPLGVAVVPEGRGMLMQMSVLENLQLGAYHFRGDYTPQLERVYARFPILEQRKHQKAGTLSGGEQQMLAISRAIMGAPRLLLLDEPSLALSPAYVDKIFRILTELRDEGLTILLSEQNARKALQYTDRGYVLDLGETTLSGSSPSLLDDPRVIGAYLGGD